MSWQSWRDGETPNFESYFSFTKSVLALRTTAFTWPSILCVGRFETTVLPTALMLGSHSIERGLNHGIKCAGNAIGHCSLLGHQAHAKLSGVCIAGSLGGTC
jgi:hypothetical protein